MGGSEGDVGGSEVVGGRDQTGTFVRSLSGLVQAVYMVQGLEMGASHGKLFMGGGG